MCGMYVLTICSSNKVKWSDALRTCYANDFYKTYPGSSLVLPMKYSMSNTEYDTSREERIAAEILVDAYNEEEQLMGWYRYLENKLHFPFKAIWLTRGSTLKDEEVEVLEMSPENDCQEEILVEVLYREGKLEDVISVPLSHLEVVKVDDATQEAIADWLYWVDRGYQ
jgi:hypothetical protein